jgi:hypothetical protein
MTKFQLHVMAAALPFLLVAPGLSYAQNAPAAAAQQAGYSTAELDQMLAPIALYPDQLLTQILMAATFPDQIAAASQWLQQGANAGIQGDQLVAVLQPLPWDPSVKSLVPFPQILNELASQPDWTASLGEAFSNQQPEVMARIQFLRTAAINAGTLVSNDQIAVEQQQGAVAIEPANPAVVAVPVYDPLVVYGAWPYPALAPLYFPPPEGFLAAGIGVDIGVGIGFSVGFGVIGGLWGVGGFDWGGGGVFVNNTIYSGLAYDHHGWAGGHWHHEGHGPHGHHGGFHGEHASFHGHEHEHGGHAGGRGGHGAAGHGGHGAPGGHGGGHGAPGGHGGGHGAPGGHGGAAGGHGGGHGGAAGGHGGGHGGAAGGHGGGHGGAAGGHGGGHGGAAGGHGGGHGGAGGHGGGRGGGGHGGGHGGGGHGGGGHGGGGHGGGGGKHH